VLDELVVSALLGYLAVAHYGRGRGQWSQSEYPAHWQHTVAEVVGQRRQRYQHIWSLRSDREVAASVKSLLREALAATAGAVLQRLYPATRIDFETPIVSDQ
jgi:hypothetical protein